MLVDGARYVGLPFKRLGRTRNGLDCWGLVRLVLEEQCDIELPVYDTLDPDDGELVSEAIEEGRKGDAWLPVDRNDMREFDFVIMRAPVKVEGKTFSLPVHIGLIVGSSLILHVQEGGTSVIQPFSALAHRVVEIRRHKGLA